MVVPAVPEIVAEQEETVLEKSDSNRDRGMWYRDIEPLLGLPARVIGESVAFLRDVIGKRADEWENRVIDGPTDGALGRLTRALEEVRPNREANSVVVEAVRLVRDAQGRKRIDDLAAMANVSTRRLERHFIEHVG